MKKFVSLLIFFLLLPTPVRADERLVIATTPHRIAENSFDSNELALLIAPEGNFGSALLKKIRVAREVYVDVAVLEEVQDLADGYTFIDEAGEEVEVAESLVAENWLTAITSALSNKEIFALPYGNPDRNYLETAAPAEYQFYKLSSQSRLSLILGKQVKVSDSIWMAGEGTSKQASEFHRYYRPILRNIHKIVPAPEVDELRLELGKLLNPTLKSQSATRYIEKLRGEIQGVVTGVRVASGNYTITSSEYELPVTVINDFSLPVDIELRVKTSNSRVVVGAISAVSIPANSQVQVTLPLQVIASGETLLAVEIRSPGGRVIGEVAEIPLRLAVISPLTTWFTTGMAIILLLAAVIQSMRRVKKRGRNG